MANEMTSARFHRSGVRELQCGIRQRDEENCQVWPGLHVLGY